MQNSNTPSTLIRKPSELEAKQTISALIYGQAGVGKTTLGCSAPAPVLFDYDGGVNRINGAHQCITLQVRSWEDTQNALREVREQFPDTRTIVIDTVGKMLDYIGDSIIRNDSRMGDRNGSLTLKGYGVRKTIFSDFLKQLAISGYNVIFLAHEKEEKQGDLTVKRPECGSAGNFNDLVREMDLVGYMQMVGKFRTLCWAPTEQFYAKNTCYLPAEDRLPLVVDENGTASGNNDYLARVIDRYRTMQEEKRKTTAAYEELLGEIDLMLAAVSSADALTETMEAIKAKAPIYNSRLVAAQKIAGRAKALGFVYDKENGKYVAA